MAFADDISRIEHNVADWVRSGITGWQHKLETRRKVRETELELNNLTDRELWDLGITRGEISAIARQAAQ